MTMHEQLDELKIGEQLPFAGNTQYARNIATSFHKKRPEKRIRFCSGINIFVRLK